jgi:hypothetical protein
MISELIQTQQLEALLNKGSSVDITEQFLPLLKARILNEHKGLFKYKGMQLTQEEAEDKADKDIAWEKDNDYEGIPANEFEMEY